YDTSKPLVIDPVLSYSTYLGGSGNDQGNGIAVDASGDAYITGWTQSASFPGTSGGFSGTQDAFVTKLNASGTAIVYSTYLGGGGSSAYSSASGIALDASGDAYITGWTQSANFPTTNGAFQGTFAGSQDAFVAELNATGSSLVYSTYLGGSTGGVYGGEYGAAIAVDASGDAYVTGTTGTSNFPTTANAFQRTSYSGGLGDAFVTEFNATGSALIYSTILGGTAGDPGYSTTLDTEGQGIALDSSDNVYVTGQTASDTFATTAGAFQTANPKGEAGGLYGAFVSKINTASSGSASLVYSTYLAGTGYGESGNGIAVDASGDAYVTGTTASNDFPTANAFQPAIGYGYGYYNAFVTKLNAAGSALVYSTYLGGKGNDSGNGIAVDAAGEAVVAGSTQSTNFPTANALQTAFGGGGQDAFVAKFSAAGSSLVYSTYLGGGGSDSGAGIALDSSGNAYVTGTTSSTNFPTSNPLQSANGGGGDAFVAKIGQSGGFALSTPSSATAGGTFNVTVTATNADGSTNTNYTGTVHFTSSDGQAVLPGNYTFVSGDQGVHTFTGLVLKTAGNQTVTATDTVSGSIAGSGTVAVSAAAASNFTLSAAAIATAGSSFNVTVTAKDAYGNTAAGYTGTVHFTSGDGQAVLPGNYSFVSGDAGSHTFGATLKTAGNQTVTATDTVTGSIAGTSGTISVTAAAASKFVFTSYPSSVKAGTPFSVTIEITDAYGNVVTNYTGTVQFSDSVGSATLPKNYTFTTGDKGVHTFNGLVLNKKGSQTIKVNDTKHSSIAGSISVTVT
ncbi:MAG TPA: SBBP repeat-containing protein, partial [Pirellulales bacterium]|nr:SBBP repeat-containing protein [Pirellulales bacterium]